MLVLNLDFNYFRTPLNYAVLGGHYRVSKLLLDRGASVDGGAKDRSGSIRPTETPLQLAAAVGSVRLVRHLLNGILCFVCQVVSDNAIIKLM